MNFKELKELIALMNENQLAEIELEREGMKVRLRKVGAGAPIYVETSHAAAPHPAAVAGSASGSLEVPAKPSGTEIKSPMVGTFYRAPAPEAPPFVEVGQTIEVGQVLCILEAMKLMNEIKAEVRGKILQILVENAQPVEFGQPLFLIESA